MNKILLSTFFLTLGLSTIGPCRGSGYFGPNEYLGQGGKNLVATPEFYWDLEVKRMARDFHPTEKPMAVPRTRDKDGLVDLSPMILATSEADAKDFADALKTNAIKPADPAKATQQHAAARGAIGNPASGPLPEEFDSEFADYDRGAYAYNQGAAHYPEAKKAWLALLDRPASDRHYRTLWATFMLGKMALKAGDPEASKWFEKTRELAKQGFADSLGMAADSYGWEGRSEWLQGHPEKAAPLFLSQLALGDESAVVSLKALVPDRDPLDGELNYSSKAQPGLNAPPSPSTATNAPAATPPPAVGAATPTQKALKAAASDPLLRRLVTAHILAVGLGWDLPGSAPDLANTRGGLWLKAIHEAKPGKVQDAEYLGWIAYGMGDYAQAQHWLDLAQPDAPAANWLHAKLQLRAGDLPGATKSLAAALDSFRFPEKYTNWSRGPYADALGDGPRYVLPSDGEEAMGQSAGGDLGLLHLERGDFIQAMELLFQAGLWSDADFIAERILTTDELKAYVDKLPPAAPVAKTGTPEAAATANSPSDIGPNLRHLLGRRLAREDRYAEAATYLPTPYDKIVLKYASALKEAANATLPKEQRAKAYFTAAWLARYDGMDLMGTEGYPDNFSSQGDFEATNLAKERETGIHTDGNWVGEKYVTETHENPATATKDEIARLKKSTLEPDKRYHYRYIAAALAMRAAELLPDQTEELADVINTAGNWIKNNDEKLADRYFQSIDRRCAKTQLGGKASAKHWFVDDAGPWSTAQTADYNALHKSLGDEKTISP